MTQHIGGYPPSPATSTPTTQVARDEAGEVGRTTADAGRQVAGTAAEQAGNVVEEVKAQSRDLLGEVRGQVQDQARTGHQKATDGVRTLSQELREMVDGTERSGPATDLVRQAADRGDRLAEWLGDREPGELVDEVRSFARRRPWAFLAGAAVAGVVAGRLTRGAVDSARADSDAATTPRHAYREPVQPVAEPGLSPYADHTTGFSTPAYPASDVPTPPQGTVPVEPYAPTPHVSTPLPPVPVESIDDPYLAPPGTYAPGRTTEDYAGEHGRARELDDRPDDPFRPGNGSSR